MFGQIEARGDFLLRQAVDLAQRHDLTTAIRKRLDGIDQQLEILGTGDLFGNIGSIIQDTCRIDFRQTFRTFDAKMAQPVEGEIAGRDKEEGPGIGHGTGGVRTEEAGVGLLHDIVDVGQTRKAHTEPRFQTLFVRQHFVDKPAGLFGILRWHREGGGEDGRTALKI